MGLDKNGRINVTWGVIASIVGWLTLALVSYGVVNARIDVLEDRSERLYSDVSELKQDVKELLRRTR